jgi:pimeloyl-ACP methyl ester carboxylesterase
MPTFSDPWRAAAPWAAFRVLPGVGHPAMYDDPQLVARVIREWAGGLPPK